MKAVSLFTSGGLGDLALRSCGFDVVLSNELLADRHAVFSKNFSQTRCITGDIWQSAAKIEHAVPELLAGDDLALFYATPPCQGMSKNGRGKLLNAIREGKKPSLDERNRLIIPTMQLASKLRPETVILENVPEMRDTLILNETGNLVQILDFVRTELGPDYSGTAAIVEFADYGVPQCRQRLITIFSRNESLVKWLEHCGTFLPPATHAADGKDGKERWVTVRDALSGVPPLDAKDSLSAQSNIEFHSVPVLDAMKYWWVENTPPGCSAFSNQCTQCGFRRTRHTLLDETKKVLTVRLLIRLCSASDAVKCSHGRAWKGRSAALMRGFTSAYKRMSFDRPASALTRNLSYACSDNKLHPVENRVLSLYEAFRIHTLDRYDYSWEREDGKPVSHKTVREIIGESIPPAGLQVILEHLLEIRSGRLEPEQFLGPLFSSNSL